VTRLVFHLVPHTHWDREWYLPEAALRVRLVGMLDDLITRLQRDDTFTHFPLDGQTVLVEDYLRARPAQAPALAALIRSGRLEVGPWYVLADEQVVSGESLIRNLLVGGRMAERLGRRSGVLYSPDAFGHPAILPDLAREFGLRHVVLWRGVAPSDRVGDAFWWKDPAGTSCLRFTCRRRATKWAPISPPIARSCPRPGRNCARSSSPEFRAEHSGIYRGRSSLGASWPAAAPSLLAGLEPGNEVRISRADAAVAALAGSAGRLGEYSVNCASRTRPRGSCRERTLPAHPTSAATARSSWRWSAWQHRWSPSPAATISARPSLSPGLCCSPTTFTTRSAAR
jgi:hypothetical protein